jgi:hypothetical protein
MEETVATTLRALLRRDLITFQPPTLTQLRSSQNALAAEQSLLWRVFCEWLVEERVRAFCFCVVIVSYRIASYRSCPLLTPPAVPFDMNVRVASESGNHAG